MKKADMLLILTAQAIGVLTVVFPGVVIGVDQELHRFECTPTQADMRGPFYKPGAPVRNDVGDGYFLTGSVRSALDCSPITGAEIEFWQAGPHGEYNDGYRATVVAGEQGQYRFETDFPGAYGSRPPHIHVRVSADGYESLVTQHYPDQDAIERELDLVLIPRGGS